MSYAVALPDRGLATAWREAARLAISHQIPPHDLDWSGETDLFARKDLPEALGPHQTRVPEAFVKLMQSVMWHSAPDRFSLLYQALWRLDRRDGYPLSQADELGRRLNLMAKSVGRDIHKMHAFVRFRELPPISNRRNFGAWFEPEHNTLEPGSSFFAKRFADMDWLIATPKLTASFRDGTTRFTAGSSKPDLPEDASEALWGTYFANIFNPARVKLNAMRSEMPKKYWKNLPETRLIPGMLADAEARVRRMQEAGATEPRQGAEAISTRYRAAMPQPIAAPATLTEAQSAAALCRNCALCETATQTVWGEGAPDAHLMIVGEQPGDREDLAGRVFVGPAGQLLRDCMALAEIAAETVWMTNAVKHFKFAPRGKMRLHQTPNQGETIACRWWLGLEQRFIQPRLTLALGATAAFALTGNADPLSGRRGTIETSLTGGPVLITWHPSYILRLPDPALQAQIRQELIADLKHARTASEQSH